MEQSAQQWQVRVLSEAWLSKIDVKASKRFSQKGLAEEAAAYVLDYLSADNWARCRQYSGKASIEGYLNRLVSNALEDFSRKRFSRPRPPTWGTRVFPSKNDNNRRKPRHPGPPRGDCFF